MKYNLIAIGILSAIILPFGKIATTINNDGFAHYQTFEAIKTGNANFLYLGQRITGYELVWLERMTGINIITLFMWFNYLVLIIGGIMTMIMIEKITKSKLAGILSMFVITFGTGAVTHLFWSGTIFNVMEMAVLLPLTILTFYLLIEKRNIKNFLFFIISAIILLLYHPTFGINTYSYIPTIRNATEGNSIGESIINPIAVIFILIGITNFTCFIIGIINIVKQEITLSQIITITSIILTAILFGVLAFTKITAFSSRMAMNLAIVINLLTVIFLGLILKNKESKSIITNSICISLLIVGIIPNLVQWVRS